jgi:protein-tyrosine phosphatase
MIKNSTIKVLFVCFGNICRSPTAEGVLRHLVATTAPRLQLEVDSAGTSDYHVGSPPDGRSQRAAQRRGIDIGRLRARKVTAGDFDRFDFILAMDRDNLLNLRALRPRASRAQLQLFLEYAPSTGLAEVPDPYLGEERDFETVLDLAVVAARGLITALQRQAVNG